MERKEETHLASPCQLSIKKNIFFGLKRKKSGEKKLRTAQTDD
jgi:hypothetical protein